MPPPSKREAKELNFKAPSGRELSPAATEGECVNEKFRLIFGYANFFHHFVTHLSEGGIDGTIAAVVTQNVIGRF